MSELINNSKEKKKLLKHMILQLHEGEAPDLVRNRLTDILREVPYDMVVEVEQELISEGLPVDEVLKLCDIHTDVLDGHIDQTGAKEIPAGHPIDIFKNENIELRKRIDELNKLINKNQAKLSNDSFISNAPKSVIAGVSESLENFKLNRDRLKNISWSDSNETN